MPRRINSGQSGLTLVELLVVIAIIGILAALLLPVFSSSTKKARQIQCAANLHELGRGLQTILANNHGYPLCVGNDDGRHVPDSSGHYASWLDQMEHEGFGIASPETNFYARGAWLCPSAAWNIPRPHPYEKVSYGYNAFGVLANLSRTNQVNVFNSFGLLGRFSTNSQSYLPVAESEVASPGDMIAFGDSFRGGIMLMRERLDALQTNGNALTRHQGKANVVFCDGHVESPTLQSLFEDTNDVTLARWNRDHLPHREQLTP
jgi:prepilin-type processing-associated H-X9-DG protein/prepilin-type N-terminal cleavage/methylation domain-containing protein